MFPHVSCELWFLLCFVMRNVMFVNVISHVDNTLFLNVCPKGISVDLQSDQYKQIAQDVTYIIRKGVEKKHFWMFNGFGHVNITKTIVVVYAHTTKNEYAKHLNVVCMFCFWCNENMYWETWTLRFIDSPIFVMYSPYKIMIYHVHFNIESISILGVLGPYS